VLKTEVPLHVSLPVAFAVGIVCGIIWLWPVGPLIKQRVLNRAAAAEAAEAAKQQGDGDKDGEIDCDELYDKTYGEHGSSEIDKTDKTSPEGSAHGVNFSEHVQTATIKEEEEEEGEKKTYLGRMAEKFAKSTYDQDLHQQSMHESSRACEIWDAAEKFDENAEQLFTYVQVFTACLNAFAHGANDVSNAIAPVSAIILIYQTGDIASKAPVQKWVLAYGGIAIVLGLLIYGYKVMKSIGYKLCALSPSRGASAELAASLFVVTASFLGIPVSSTQCIVGAVSGVGLVSGWKNVQWLFLLRVAVGWAMVFLGAAILSAGIFAMFAYSPSLEP
jgi:sodium-dependent phosphate transporter